MDGSWERLWELASVGLEWCQWPHRSHRFLDLSNLSLASAVASLSFAFHDASSLLQPNIHVSPSLFFLYLLSIVASSFFIGLILGSLSVSVDLLDLNLIFFCVFFRPVPSPAPSFYSFICISLHLWLYLSFFRSFHTPFNSTLISPCESQQQRSSFVPVHSTMW